MDRAQGKPPRYPLEADVVRVDQVESEPLVSDVPPFPTVPGSTAGSPQDPPANAAIVASSVKPSSVVAEKTPGGVAIEAPYAEPSSVAAEELLQIASA